MEKINASWDFTGNMDDGFPSSKIIMFGFYRTWIRITSNIDRLYIGFNFNFYLVAKICVWPTCFFIEMIASGGDDYMKRIEFCHVVDVIFLLHVYKNEIISCDSCYQSFIRHSISHSIAKDALFRCFSYCLFCCFYDA